MVIIVAMTLFILLMFRVKRSSVCDTLLDVESLFLRLGLDTNCGGFLAQMFLNMFLFETYFLIGSKFRVDSYLNTVIAS